MGVLQDRAKPGRQIVTFLLICNLAIWVIYTFEVQKVEESPVQVSQLGQGSIYSFKRWPWAGRYKYLLRAMCVSLKAVRSSARV